MDSFVKKLVGLALVFVLLAPLTACGKADFDSGSYVTAMLDAAYHADYKAYKEQELGSKSDAEKIYKANLAALTDSFVQVFDTEMNDESRAALEEAMAAILAKTKYETLNSKADGDHYLVEMKITPIELTETMESEEFADSLQKSVDEALDKNADASTEELMSAQTQKLIEQFAGIGENPTYSEAVEITVNVSKNKDGAYELTDEGWEEIDKTLIR